ncbi:cell division protein SepF [Nesterenkonia alkaliphila]|uniref:Cell division protein SepF n=1 Tax=Nesterenkonia alkaliphila TaxID=1463631 RepID=A0A7K1UG61_9MICC|nr:cell division protein SepF [Nesterenkonia alkaliphila]MVT25455.1 cell division protein SepF [Nesterenkonia alkaliphila]GFZ83823.1 cell division protein SepF 2 [Nesterenkonia alkaliphila]
MAGAFKKTMIYLGLADGDDYHEDSFGSDENRSSRHASTGGAATATATQTRPAAAPAQPTGAVVSLADHAAATAAPERNEDPAGSYNSTNLAVDPDYRAPVTPIKRAPSSRDESSEMRKITTVHPRSYNDAKIIGESFREDIPVIMNVTEMGEAEAKRLVDFAAGLVFGLGGSIERVTNKVFLLTPKNVEVLAEEKPAAEPEASAKFFNQS